MNKAELASLSVGDNILYKQGQRRGKPTAAMIVGTARRSLTVYRPNHQQIVQIKPEDVIGLVTGEKKVKVKKAKTEKPVEEKLTEPA